MKKIISIAVGLILLFSMGCSNPASDNPNITDVKKISLKLVNQSSVDLKNVKWMNILFSTNNIADFLMGSTVKKDLAEEGSGYIYFTRKADSLELRTASVVAVEKEMEEQFVFTDNTVVVEVGNPSNTGTLKDIKKTVQSLKLINQSNSNLENVKWMTVQFSNNATEDFLTGSTVKQELSEAGSGYIYFTRKSDNLALRTPDVVTVEKNTEAEFIFTDDTVVVEVDNTLNTGTLKDIQKSNTKLKIVNGTAADILEPTWNQVLFETVANGKNLVAGTSVEKAVNSESGYITFKVAGDTTVWRTTEQVSINNFESKIFTFEAATQVTQVNNISIVKPLSELLIPKMISINTEIIFISDSTISMSWDAVPGATGYKIYKSNIKTNHTAAFFKDVTSTSCLIDNLGSTEDCFFWITATNIYGESGYSTFKYVTFKTFTVGGVGPAGGNVFYDKGDKVGGWQYLEAAPVATEIRAQWGAYRDNVEGTSTVTGSGKSNTKIIIKFLNKTGEVNKAAQVAESLNYEGFADWFLPSKDELNLMYLNLKDKGIGGFGSSYYWSSSQGSAYGAWHQRFSDGSQDYANYGDSYYKNYSHSVRVVRAF